MSNGYDEEIEGKLAYLDAGPPMRWWAKAIWIFVYVAAIALGVYAVGGAIHEWPGCR